MIFRYIETKKYSYDDSEDIISEQLMMEELNKYEVLLASVKWNTMPLEKYQSIALASVSEKLKDDSLKISNSINVASNKAK